MHIDAVGGSFVAQTGAHLLASHDGLGVVGLAEGVRSIPAHALLLARLRKQMAGGNYDLVILMDYPGFHLRVAAAASAFGIPVLYYIAPQLWAWGAWRMDSIRKHVRQMAVILPFEEDFYRSRGVDAQFVGHPLLDRDQQPTVDRARTILRIPEGDPILGLLPGSRATEVRRLWPTFRDAAKQLRQLLPRLHVLVSAVNGVEYNGAPEFQYCSQPSSVVLAASDAALCKSGTATLEAALSGTPMVIAYRMHPLTYAVAKRAVRLEHVGLVNLIADQRICPEFLQSEATARTLAQAVAPLLDPEGEAARRQLVLFDRVRSRLGGAGATKRVAAMAERMVA